MIVSPSAAGARSGRERWAVLALLGVGLGARLRFVSVFPTLPFSDFRALIGFGLQLRDHGLAARTGLWDLFNPGLPMILALLYRVFPGSGPQAARIATAVATGLVPVIPLLVWRPVLGFRIRLLAGMLLALWPGQVFFSGVVAQDNWELLPLVGLASLAVRRLLEGGPGYPLAAGLLYAAAAAIRQEMLIVLLPFLASASFGPRGRLRRESALLLLSAGLPLLALSSQRYLATGRFGLTTAHGGLAVLGSFEPGAFSSGWVDPRPYVAAVEPSLLLDNRRYFAGAWRLAWNEARRRPGFHAVRIATQGFRLALEGDELNLFWSLRAPEALPAAKRPAGERFGQTAAPWLRAELAVIQGLFAGGILLGFWRRDAAVLVLGAVVLLKVLLQAVLSPMARLLMPCTALELLAIALAIRLVSAVSVRRKSIVAALAALVPLFLYLTVPPLEKLVERLDRETAGVMSPSPSRAARALERSDDSVHAEFRAR